MEERHGYEGFDLGLWKGFWCMLWLVAYAVYKVWWFTVGCWSLMLAKWHNVECVLLLSPLENNEIVWIWSIYDCNVGLCCV